MKRLERAPTIAGRKFKDDVLVTMVSPQMTDFLTKVNEDYLYWDKLKYKKVPADMSIENIWAIVKTRRLNTPYRITFGSHQFYWNQNSRIQEALHFLDMNIGGSLESPGNLSKGDKNKYLLSSIMEEAIASSQIEGAVTSRKKAKEMLRKNIKPKDKSEQMIYNNFLTIREILKIKDEPLNFKTLLRIHLLITRNTLSNHADEGRIRLDNEVNVVDVSNGEVIHIPPDVVSLPVMLQQLFDFFNDDAGGIFIHPVVKACIIHFMIGYIHPFVDGNGRTARALFYWFLIKKGYWLTEFLSISKIILRSKGQYARAFQYTEIDQNDMTYFIAYNLHAMKLSFIELRRYIERKNEQKRQITRFFGEDDLSYRQSIILDWFINEPALVLTVKEAENRLGVSNLSARLDINSLLDKGYLKKVNLNKVLTGFLKGEKLLLTERKHRVTSTRLDANQPELF